MKYLIIFLLLPFSLVAQNQNDDLFGENYFNQNGGYNCPPDQTSDLFGENYFNRNRNGGDRGGGKPSGGIGGRTGGKTIGTPRGSRNVNRGVRPPTRRVSGRGSKYRSMGYNRSMSRNSYTQQRPTFRGRRN